MVIVGINAYHGDVSAVLLRGGELVAAVEEERFRRVKHWAGFPRERPRVCRGRVWMGACREAVCVNVRGSYLSSFHLNHWLPWIITQAKVMQPAADFRDEIPDACLLQTARGVDDAARPGPRPRRPQCAAPTPASSGWEHPPACAASPARPLTGGESIDWPCFDPSQTIVPGRHGIGTIEGESDAHSRDQCLPRGCLGSAAPYTQRAEQGMQNR
jgi:hypothetical protein